MTDCIPFTIHVGENAAEVLAYLRAELVRRGGSGTGDASSGTFSIPLPIGGTINGSYKGNETKVTVTIARRPALVTCGMIESKVQDIILDAKSAVKRKNA